MTYKLIKEWKDGNDHEITMYKYNISHDEMIRYYYNSKESNAVKITTYLPDELRVEFYEVV